MKMKKTISIVGQPAVHVHSQGVSLRRFALSFGVLVSIAAPAHAITLSVETTTIGHQYSSSARSTVDSIMGSFWGAATAPTFTTSMSKENLFSLTVAAPAGQEFVVAGAPGSIGMVMSIGKPLSLWIASGWDGGVRDYMPTVVSFSGYSGPGWYSDTTGITVDQQGRALSAEGSLWWSGQVDMRFQSVNITADLSALTGRAMPTMTFKPDLAVGISFQNVLRVGNVGDPGPAVALVSMVPEPSTAVLFLLGVAGLFARVAGRPRLGRG